MTIYHLVEDVPLTSNLPGTVELGYSELLLSR